MKSKIALLIIILTASGLYLFTLRGVLGNADNAQTVQSLTNSGQPFESSHERTPYAFLLSLTEKRFDLSQELADFSSPDVAYINGKFYSFFPAGIPALIYPAYLLGGGYNIGLLAVFGTMAFFSLLSMLLIILIAKQIFQLPLWSAILAGLIYAFATTSWNYAITIYQHAPTVTFVLFGFYCAWQYSQFSRWPAAIWASIAGAACALAIFIDYPNAVLVAPIMVYLVWKSFHTDSTGSNFKINWRASVLIGVIVFGLINTAHLYYNKEVFGSYTQFHNPAPRYTPETFETLRQTLAEATTEPSSALTIFSETSLVTGFYELFIAVDKGLFIFAPVLLFALWGIFKLRKSFNIEYLTLLTIALVNIFLYASFSDPWGGWAYGPRYLIPTMAILALFAVVPIANGSYQLLKKSAIFVLIIYSSAVALLGVVTSNLIPPKVEAVPLGVKYTYARNIDFIKDNMSGNFMYNNYFKDGISAIQYYGILLTIVILLFAFTIFVLPRLGKEKNA